MPQKSFPMPKGLDCCVQRHELTAGSLITAALPLAGEADALSAVFFLERSRRPMTGNRICPV